MGQHMTTSQPIDYPVRLFVDEATVQSRLTVFFRLLMIIPHAIVLMFLGIAAYVIYVISWFAILFTGRYPEGMLRFITGVLRWGVRVNGYYMLLTDRYPPFSLGDDPAYPIRMESDLRVDGRSRLSTFWPIRWILAIPHLIILGVLNYAITVVVFIAWVIALFTGRVPAGLHNFIAGYLRWYTRAYAYILNLIDDYPPFSLS